MNNDQITALAREYAEASIDPQGFSKDTYEEMAEEKAENVTYILRWLLRRFCLVEKGKATDLCRLTLEHGDSVDYGLIDGLTDIVCDIFSEQYQQVAEGLDNSEIAKEVRNEPHNQIQRQTH